MTDLLESIEPPAELLGDISADAPSGQSVHTDARADADEMFAPASKDDFDWYGDDAVILHEQLAIAVYRNKSDGVVIRQETRNWDEEDNFIILRDHEAVSLLIATLQRELKRKR